jgi:predicted RNA-binding Zn ribbon-like protein
VATQDSVQLAVDLVNTEDELHPGRERLTDVAAFRAFLAGHGGEEAAAAVTGRDLRAAWRLREKLRAAWEARTEERAVATLNDVVADAHAVPRLVKDWAGRWRFRYGTASWLAAETSMALLEELRVGGFGRFGICAAAPCRCVFVDRSRNQGRRYCSTLCANRAAQASYRARQRAPGDRTRSGSRSPRGDA